MWFSGFSVHQCEKEIDRALLEPLGFGRKAICHQPFVLGTTTDNARNMLPMSTTAFAYAHPFVGVHSPFLPAVTNFSLRRPQFRALSRPRFPAVPRCALPFPSLPNMAVLDSRLLALTALVTLGYQFVFGAIAYALKFDKLTDFAGGTNFLVLAVLTFCVGALPAPSERQIVLSALVVLWALRLAGFLFYRIILWGEDRRFDDKRDKLARVLVFWSLQALWVWTVSLPVTVLNASSRSVGLGVTDFVGWAMFVFGLTFEAVADQQKLKFKQTEASNGRWTDVGVWKWTRHPNYFGEMILWTGAFVSACRVFVGVDWIAALGPVFIILLLLFVSGIPLLEQSADKKHAGKDEYRTYKNRTSVLFPIPPSVYAGLPEGLKKTLLLDFPLYNSSKLLEKAHSSDDESDGEASGGNNNRSGRSSPNETTPIVEKN